MAAILDLSYYTRSYLLSTCTTMSAIPENLLKVFQKEKIILQIVSVYSPERPPCWPF